ncbi:MAG: PepSY-like domain-containing protein, partial [Bacteroidia bacterium]
MKTIITTVALVLAMGTGFAQSKVKEANVPKAVLDAFKAGFKGAKADKWEKEKDGNYEAEFKQGGVETSASYSPEGKLMDTEVEMKTADLPKGVSEYVSKNYAGYKISEAAKITDASGKVSYEAEVSKGKEEMDLIFDSNGGFVKKIVEQEDEKDKD